MTAAAAARNTASTAPSNVVPFPASRCFARVPETAPWGDRRLGRVTAQTVYHAALLHVDRQTGEARHNMRGRSLPQALATILGVSRQAIFLHLATLIDLGLSRRELQWRSDGGCAASRYWFAIDVEDVAGGDPPVRSADTPLSGALTGNARARRIPDQQELRQKKEGDLKIDEVVLGRDAPLPEKPEPPDPPPEPQPTDEVGLQRPTGAVVHDPAAYEYAAAAERRRNMLRGLRGYITQVLRGEDRKRAFAVVNRFIEVVDDTDAWRARPRPDHTTLTQLQKSRKACRGKIRALPLDSYEPEDGPPIDEVSKAQLHCRTEADIAAAMQRRRMAHEQERAARLEARATERLRRHGSLW